MDNLNVPLRGTQVQKLPLGLNITRALWYYLPDGTRVYFPNRKERRNKVSGKNTDVQHVPIEIEGKICFKRVFHLKTIGITHKKKHHYEQ